MEKLLEDNGRAGPCETHGAKKSRVTVMFCLKKTSLTWSSSSLFAGGPRGVTMGWADISAAPLPSSAKGGKYAVPLGALLAALLPAASLGTSTLSEAAEARRSPPTL